MCGIAGLINLRGEKVDPRRIVAMIDPIRHRGPDGEGIWTEGQIGLGHRRLAIIDTSAGAQQPMISSNDRFVLSYNGEVYNFRNLRRDLEKLGKRFVSNSDTEVVLESLATWGHQAIERFNGMFALALWDRANQTLLLARDRYGIKPLYWSRSPSEIVFSSEIKAINAVSKHKPQLDADALVEYLTFQNVFSDRTLFENTRVLPPGHTLTIDGKHHDSQVAPTKYWDFDFSEPNSPISRGEYEEELQRLLEQAVNRQLVSDVEIGTYLSGGVDSASISAIASRSIPNLKSFTCGFDLSSASGLELGFDEREPAEELSALYGTEHYELVLKAGDMERCMGDLIWHLEDLRVGQSYPNYYAAKLASRFVKVVLGGTGGDELFGGYPWRYFHSTASGDFRDFADSYYRFWQRMLSEDEKLRLLRPIAGATDFDRSREQFLAVLATKDTGSWSSRDQLNTSLYLESKTFLHGLLVVDDKLSMAHSLENRVPFLDNDLVDFASSCPSLLKVASPHSRIQIDENLPGSKKAVFGQSSTDGKRILRSAVQKFVPEHIVEARKQGFSAPDASWFRGQSIDFVRRRLLGRPNNLSQFMDEKVIAELVDDHLSGRRNRRLLIWSLLSLDSWIEIFL